MRVLDLFSGIGGFSLGLERAGMETVAFVEIEPFCQKVLAKHWPGVPIHKDIRELKGDAIGPVDLICGGYPCQPFSTAGKRGGASDDRHLWPEYLRLIQELRPSWVIGENVAGHISMGLDQVLADLEGEGYTWEAFVIPACAVDAPHRRDRVWIIANRIELGGRADAGAQSRAKKECAELFGENREALPGHVEEICGDVANAGRNAKRSSEVLHRKKEERGERGFDAANSGETLADAKRIGLLQSREHGFPVSTAENLERKTNRVDDASRWEPEPAVGRVAHGVPRRVDRLKALGNAVVPQIPEIIGRAIMDSVSLLDTSSQTPAATDRPT